MIALYQTVTNRHTGDHGITPVVVQWAGCRCVDREHSDHDRLDWATDRGRAFDHAFDAWPIGPWHLVRIEVEDL